jgi:hypothetical protein
MKFHGKKISVIFFIYRGSAANLGYARGYACKNLGGLDPKLKFIYFKNRIFFDFLNFVYLCTFLYFSLLFALDSAHCLEKVIGQ